MIELVLITNHSTNHAVSKSPTYPNKSPDAGKENHSRVSVNNRKEEIKEISNNSNLHIVTYKSVNERNI